ncbi:MAG: glycerophosphodiester phosphodiesterase [Anaerolineales bacterium]|nr:glycerophosphodiester phosphodiesterase [Anaerolineales bacterium]
MFEITAHRGAPEFAPENTLPAFFHALTLGADAVEFDVRLTADRVPVVYHYFYLEILTSLSGPVFHSTWQELQQAILHLPGQPGPDSTPGKYFISSLDQVLDALSGRIGLELEIKGPEPGCEQIIASVLRNHPRALQNLEITSYEITLLERFQRLVPGIPVDLLVPLNEPWMKADVLAYTALQRGLLAGARAVHLHASQLSPETVNSIREGGCEVHAWGVNDHPALNTARDLQIKKVCTDRLRLALQYRKEAI